MINHTPAKLQDTDTRPVYQCSVTVCLPAFISTKVPNYTAWWQSQQDAKHLSKVSMQWHSGCKLNPQQCECKSDILLSGITPSKNYRVVNIADSKVINRESRGQKLSRLTWLYQLSSGVDQPAIFRCSRRALQKVVERTCTVWMHRYESQSRCWEGHRPQPLEKPMKTASHSRTVSTSPGNLQMCLHTATQHANSYTQSCRINVLINALKN